MKSIITVALLLLLSSSLHAQARRRPAVSAAANSTGLTSFDSVDVVNPLRSSFEPRPPAAVPQGDNLVPVRDLRIPAKALKEYERSQTAFQRGDLHASTEHLQKALHIYPDFVQAHNALGLRFLQLGEYEKALAEHGTALSLDPQFSQTHQDISFVFLLLNRNEEAEKEARQALDLDPHAVVGRYVLGRAIISQGHATPEAIEMLRQSEDAFPNASLVLAQVHFSQGHTDQVIAELRHYLRSPSDPTNKQKAECWVAQLSQQPAPAGCPAGVARPSFR